ncbi:hypothetical protein PP707_04835 [Acetobacter pasteurianus]|nr:hypothetical protein [Acetobacter pasteurianus]
MSFNFAFFRSRPPPILCFTPQRLADADADATISNSTTVFDTVFITKLYSA